MYYLWYSVVKYFDLVLQIQCTVSDIHQALNLLICAFDENKTSIVSVLSCITYVVLINFVGEDEESIIRGKIMCCLRCVVDNI